MLKPFQISLAPDRLWQAINPWTFNQQGANFGVFNINIGLTPEPELEQEILNDAGSYGRQIGRIGDALEVLLKRIDRQTLSEEDRDAIDALQGQLAAVRQIKRRARATRSRAENYSV